MSGFVNNNKTVHEGHKETGFVRANAKGKRHRWDLKQAPPKPGTKKIKSPAVEKLEEIPDESPETFPEEIEPAGVVDSPAKAHHTSVNINLDPRSLAAFKGFQGKRKGKR